MFFKANVSLRDEREFSEDRTKSGNVQVVAY